MLIECSSELFVDSENDCNICLESFKQSINVILLPCDHYFHKKCID